MNVNFFKKKSVWITTLVVVVIGGGLYLRSRANAGPFYDAPTATTSTLVQTVEVTGETKPETRVDLSFKTSGKIKTVNVIVGQQVKAGDVLATLDAQDATFAMRRAAATLAQMRANLAARQAQDSPQTIQMAEAARDQAKANFEKAQSDLIQIQATSAEQVRQAQIALETAQQNQKNSGTGADLTVQTSLSSLRTSLTAASAVLSSSVTESDAILGVENSGANDTYESVLGIYAPDTLTRAQGMVLAVHSAIRHASALVAPLNTNSSATDVFAAGQATTDALQQAGFLLDATQAVLTNSGTSSGLTITDLTTKRSSIQALRASVATQYSGISSAVQTLQTSENGRTTTQAQLQNALRTAQSNLTIAIANQQSQVKAAETAIEVQRAALSSAEASLSQHKTPSRAVDLQVLRAQLQDASVSYEQAAQNLKDTELTAPVDGTISDVVPTIGEQTVQGSKVMSLVVTQNYTVEASVPEADIAKVQVGQSATTTLDAFGDDVKFGAKVLSVEPDRIKIQDAVFYKISVALDKTDRPVKPGMTANVTITTASVSDALIIPLRAVRSESGVRIVKVLQPDNSTKDVVVELGLRGDDGRVQIIAGLQAGDKVVVGELTAAEYAAQKTAAK